MTIGEMQIGGMLVLTLLTLMLTLHVPRRARKHPVFGRARLLMAGGTGLVALQLLLQYLSGLRLSGVTQGVFLNLLFFIPSSILISMAILKVQRQGDIRMREWLPGVVAYAVAAVLLTWGALTDDQPLHVATSRLRLTEYVVALLYSVMQLYYLWLTVKGYLQLRVIVSDYYDRDRQDLLGWMWQSTFLLSVTALFVPLVIFADSGLLQAFSVVFFIAISFCASSFYRYGVSSDSYRVEEAQESEREAQEAGSVPVDAVLSSDESDQDIEVMPPEQLTTKELQRVSAATTRWLSAGGCLEAGVTLAQAAREMHVPQYQLKNWLRIEKHELFKSWVNFHRIEHAKRLLTAHPDWNNDTIARECGFNSRNYFQQVFRGLTGQTPSDYVSNPG